MAEEAYWDERAGGLPRANIDDVVRSFDEMRANGQDVDVDTVLAASKAKDHPLHMELWGDSDRVAAMRWRRIRCRQIIQQIKFRSVQGDTVIETRAFESIKTGTKRVYLPISEIVKNTDWREQLVREIELSIDQMSMKLRRLRMVEAEERIAQIRAEVRREYETRRQEEGVPA